MPVVNPATVWQETNRWYDIGSELGRFQDKNGRDMVLALSHEEIVTDLVRREIQSHRQLPQMIYHMQTKWRDDPRPRAGLIRAVNSPCSTATPSTPTKRGWQRSIGRIINPISTFFDVAAWKRWPSKLIQA